MKKFFKVFTILVFIFNSLTIYSINIKKDYSDKYMIDLHKSPEHWKFMIDPDLKKIGINCSFASSDDNNFLTQIDYGVMFGIR